MGLVGLERGMEVYIVVDMAGNTVFDMAECTVVGMAECTVVVGEGDIVGEVESVVTVESR